MKSTGYSAVAVTRFRFPPRRVHRSRAFVGRHGASAVQASRPARPIATSRAPVTEYAHVRAYFYALTDRQTPLVSWGPAPATRCRRWAPTTTRRRPGRATTPAGGGGTHAPARTGA